MDNNTERNSTSGWTWLYNASKWHYFEGQKSLCGRHMILRHPTEGYEIGNNDSADNCKVCARKVLQYNEQLEKVAV